MFRCPRWFLSIRSLRLRKITHRRLEHRLRGAAVLIAALLAAGVLSAQVIGGFDLARGGTASLRDGTGYDSVEGLRNSILDAFPGVTITASSTLTAAYLDSVDVAFLSSWYSGSTAITPLSTGEQDALYDFVLGGGTALIFVDNSDLSDASHESLIDPFGLDVTGKINLNAVPGTILDPSLCPATQGPYGTITSYTTAKPGWFSDVGPHAVALDTLTNGRPSLAYIDFGVLGPGSGAVLLCSDSSHLMDAYSTPATLDMVNNMLDAAFARLTGADEAGPPRRAALGPCVPNPFNPATTVGFTIPQAGRVDLAVYDLAGRRLRVLLDGWRDAGEGSVRWDGRDADGRALPSGTYLLRLRTAGGVSTQKAILAR